MLLNVQSKVKLFSLLQMKDLHLMVELVDTSAVFPTFKSFIAVRSQYKHCHELLVDHINNKTNLAGRLVFDFDIQNKSTVPANFKDQVEDVVIEVAERFMDESIDPNKLEFIWSTSENPHKFSKHLTVKHMYFDNWNKLSKIFYRLFCAIWDDKYKWIKSRNLIDFQIVRNNAFRLEWLDRLRFGGYDLKFDNDKHKLLIRLIRIYFQNQRLVEQTVRVDNISPSVFLRNYINGVDTDFAEPTADTTILDI